MRMQSLRVAGGVACWLLASAAIGRAATNPQAIEEVRAGKRPVAQASWWGFDPAESTAALQAAIDSGAKKVVVEKMPSPWIVDKLRLADDQELFFERGVEVLAKKGGFHGTSDSLFSAAGKRNIRLIGPGAVLRMRRADYDHKADYKHAEWRHVINPHGCTGVTIEGLTLAESGGDGIYLGAGPGGKPCKDVIIRDVVCDRNYRQGISVISAENLLIDRCTLKDTAGTPPAAGIDFEPNSPKERLTNCVMRDCVIENNQGYALHVYAPNLDGETHPTSLRVENCVTRGANARSVSVVVSGGPKGATPGLIELVNCRFEDIGTTAITVCSTSPRGTRLRMVNCTLADPAEQSKAAASILLQTRPDTVEPLGGIELAGVTVRDRIDRPIFKLNDPAGVPLVDVTGHVTLERNGKKTEFNLDEATLAQLIPVDKATHIARWPLGKTPLAPVQANATVGGKLSPARLRGEALFLIPARQGETVAMQLASQAVGRYNGKPVEVRIISPAGKAVKRCKVEFQQEGPVDFTAAETGVYRVECQAGSHTTRIVSCSHAAMIAGEAGPVRLLATTGEFYFLVPAGVHRCAVRFWGEGDLERVSAAVFDPTGKQAWKQDDISAAQSFQIERGDASQDEVWRFKLSRPKVGVMEDHCVEMRGMPVILGFRPDGLLTPTKAAQ
ncbi:MAG: hypothetical protein GX575_33750 [Candidatus Anammoximicrobium sp.]|nr:hypothetical protein [Candidatus Anammoximicrobium sp.]